MIYWSKICVFSAFDVTYTLLLFAAIARVFPCNLVYGICFF